MKVLLISLCVVVQALLLRTCGSNQVLTPAAFLQWVEAPENGLHVSKTVGDYKFDLQYKPTEYVVLTDAGTAEMSNEEMIKQGKAISDMQYYTLRISDVDGGDLLKDDVSSVDHFSSRLVYFAGAMQHDISLIENGDTLSCLLFHFERTYGIDPRSTFVLGFAQPVSAHEQEASDKKFLFNDHELGTGPVMLTVSKDDLNNIPSIKAE